MQFKNFNIEQVSAKYIVLNSWTNANFAIKYIKSKYVYYSTDFREIFQCKSSAVW